MACSELTSPHSAQSVTPYEAFSTLQPTTTRPSSTSAAAPTGKSEYGAYACRIASMAAARSATQSISMPPILPHHRAGRSRLLLTARLSP